MPYNLNSTSDYETYLKQLGMDPNAMKGTYYDSTANAWNPSASGTGNSLYDEYWKNYTKGWGPTQNSGGNSNVVNPMNIQQTANGAIAPYQYGGGSAPGGNPVGVPSNQNGFANMPSSNVNTPANTGTGTDWQTLLAQLYGNQSGTNTSATANNPYASPSLSTSSTPSTGTQSVASLTGGDATQGGSWAYPGIDQGQFTSWLSRQVGGNTPVGSQLLQSIMGNSTLLDQYIRQYQPSYIGQGSGVVDKQNGMGSGKYTPGTSWIYPDVNQDQFKSWLVNQMGGDNLTTQQLANAIMQQPSLYNPYVQQYKASLAATNNNPNTGGDIGSGTGVTEGKSTFATGKYTPSTTWIYPNVDQGAFRTWLTNKLGTGGVGGVVNQATIDAIMRDPAKYNPYVQQYQHQQQASANPTMGIQDQINEWIRRLGTGQYDSGQQYGYQGDIYLFQNLLNSLNKTPQSDNPFGYNYQAQFTDPTQYYNTAADYLKKAYDPSLINQFYDTSGGNIGAAQDAAATRAANVGAAMGGSQGLLNPQAYASAMYSNAASPFASQFGANESARANSLMTGNASMNNNLAQNSQDLFSKLFARDQAGVTQTQQQQQLQQALSQLLFGQGTTNVGLGQTFSTGNVPPWLNAIIGMLGQLGSKAIGAAAGGGSSVPSGGATSDGTNYT
jgi:hypothetical protein